MNEAEIVIETRGACGLATLNRPAALNALNLGMIRTLAEALAAWQADPAVASIVLTAAGGRAFCAGADIRALYELGRAGRRDEQIAFFREEYRLDQAIARSVKPVVALIDGVVMGGGAGLSVHAAYCVAGDAVTFAMPEVGIGFFPDVGAAFFLSRLPGAIGAYLALTGGRITTGDVVALKLVHAFVPTLRHKALIDRLAAGEAAGAAVSAESAAAPASALEPERSLIERCFDAPSVVEIVGRLKTEPSEFAQNALAALAAKSPMSLAIALRQVLTGRSLTLEEALAQDFRIAARILDGGDYYEGVRAVIIDKDQRPKWRPAELAAVAADDIEPYFAPLAQDALPELDFAEPPVAQ